MQDELPLLKGNLYGPGAWHKDRSKVEHLGSHGEMGALFMNLRNFWMPKEHSKCELGPFVIRDSQGSATTS